MDEQGHGTANWEWLEQWALGELLKIVKLRDGRHMPGPPELQLQDFIGKRLRVRYEDPERDAYDRQKRERGTFVFTITSVQVRTPPESGPEIELGIVPYEVPLVGGGSVRFVAVRYIPRGEPSPRETVPNVVAFVSVTQRPHEYGNEHELSRIMATGTHVLWD